MVHLITYRDCKSYVYGENLQYGTHEQIERNIAQRKYPYKSVRDGYNIPFATELKRINYRCKKEVLPDFVRDLNAINLNPHPNTTSFMGLFKAERYRSVGRSFYVIRYLFKWANRFPFKYFNPLNPVPVNMDREPQPFNNDNWAYNYIIGYLDDPVEYMKDLDTNEVYKHDDTL